MLKLKTLLVAVDMGLIGRLKWVDGSKKQCKSLFWRARAALKKAVKNNNNGGGKNNVKKFQYDPSSYALNFDDGLGRYEVKGGDDWNKKAIWVYYVVWVESETESLS